VLTFFPKLKDFCLLTVGAGFYTAGSPPYEWSGAAWVALAPLFFVLRHKTPVEAFTVGFWYALLCCVGIMRWLYFAGSVYFGLLFPWDVLFTFTVYAFFGGFYTGLFALLACKVMHRESPLLRWVAVPAAWVTIEAARCYVGFSWVILGYTQYRHLALIQIADTTGVYGLSFLMALSSYVCAETLMAFRSRQEKIPVPWLPFGGLLVSIALTGLYGAWRMEQYRRAEPAFGPPVTIALVRSKIPAEQRWMREHYARILLQYASATRRGLERSQPHLVVWPEFAVGFYLNHRQLLQAQLSRFVEQTKAFLLLGAPRVEETSDGFRYYNSAYLLSPHGDVVDVYDKIRLVPFAEYRPFTTTSAPHPADQPPHTFTAGRRSTVFSFPHGPFGVMICYEATYPHLARRLVRNGAQFLVNISNDTWLAAGGQAAVAQHFSMAVFRAVETHRFLARSATSGVSGFIDPVGRSHQLSDAEDDVTLGDVFPQHEQTLYTRYGDWFALLCTALTAMTLLLERKSALFNKDSIRAMRL
jgi:apolipoprotein N-acyltransferase